MQLGKVPRIRLGEYPTPLAELSHLTKLLSGPRVFIKREDLVGIALGGNKVRKAKVILKLGEWQQEWEVIAEVVEEGFHRVAPLRVQRVSPAMKVGDKQIRFVSKVMPFTQGSLIEEMRQRGLGRPSTYAKIVQTLLSEAMSLSGTASCLRPIWEGEFTSGFAFVSRSSLTKP